MKIDYTRYSLKYLKVAKATLYLDIDTDIEDALRSEVFDYVTYKYGESHVAGIITFGNAKAKNAVRRAGKALNMPKSLPDEVAKTIEVGMTINDAIDGSPDLAQLINSEYKDDVLKLLDVAKHFENLKMNASVHACGRLITDLPVTDYIPLCKAKDGSWVTQIEAPTCEDMGLLKMDFLGLRTLGYVHEALDSIKKNTGKLIKYEDIPINDPKVYQFLAHGNTATVFQLESSLFTSIVESGYQDVDGRLKAIEVSNKTDEQRASEYQSFGDICFSRLCDMNALVRPGPNAYIPDYCHNILHPEDVHYDIQEEEPILKQSYGIMLFQEQVMTLCKNLAGFSAGQADTIRKGMGQTGPVVG